MMFNPPKGEPPEVCWVECCALIVDHEYQRMIEGGASQKLIREIAENWDWRLCAPLTVSHREDEPEGTCEDPGYYVIDGQHRLRAAELRGDIESLPCIISKFETFEAEAMAFVSINSARRQVTAIDKYHARVAAKEPLALQIKSMVEDAGMRVTRHADAALWKPGEIAFPDAVGRALMREDNKDLGNGATGVALGMLCAFGDVPLTRGKDMFDALLLIADGDWSEVDFDEDYMILLECIGAKRQAAWLRLREKHMAANDLRFADRALAEVMLAECPVKITLNPQSGRGQRRFETKKPGNGVELPPEHPAVQEDRTLFPSTRKDPEDTRVFKSGHNSSKIGSMVEKGDWKGFPIFTLTLEERATCPDTCKQLLSCYGNNMHLAHRLEHGPKLEERIWDELRELQEGHPDGFVIRLHVLGDFYSLKYVHMWQEALHAFPALHVYGYTAHDPDGEIGEELLGMAVSQWERFAIRFSGSNMQEMAALVIDPPETTCPDNAFICPAQKGQTACCATCALCWSTEKNVAFLKH